MKPIIEVKRISKKYLIREALPYYSLRDSISRVLSFRKTAKEEFWALKNVSFNVQEGEFLGIVGANGAGKSTLLKILSGITTPTKGEVVLRGRIASLLEVGTGFHPELSGRENIYLYGAILGMKKKEIVERFDEIVEFAGIAHFLDTPVKYFSSGMYTRLAFSVAAHMKPEILVIDEVLAVGDAAFQKKCVTKMRDLSQSGCTILFVSHNMSLITALCKRSLLLDSGSVVAMGSTEGVVAKYLKVTPNTSEPLSSRKDREGDGRVKLTKMEITNGEDGSVIKSFDKLRVSLGFKERDKVSNIEVKMAFIDMSNRVLFRIDSDIIPWSSSKRSRTLTFETDKLNLAPTMCTVNIGLFADGVLSDYLKNVYMFDIIAGSDETIKIYGSDVATILLGHRLV